MPSKQNSDQDIARFIGLNNILDYNKVRDYIQSNAKAGSRFQVVKSLKTLSVSSTPLCILILFVLSSLQNMIEAASTDSIPIISIVKFGISILLIIIGLTIVLMYDIYTQTNEYEKQVEEISRLVKKEYVEFLNMKCEECAAHKANVDVNSYNLFTYSQILRIEESLSGENAAVYCYSLHRDDGGGVGPDEAARVVKANLEKKIKYYFIYFQEPEEQQGSSYQGEPGEIYLNLSEVMGDYYSYCLDYQIYNAS